MLDSIENTSVLEIVSIINLLSHTFVGRTQAGTSKKRWLSRKKSTAVSTGEIKIKQSGSNTKFSSSGKEPLCPVGIASRWKMFLLYVCKVSYIISFFNYYGTFNNQWFWIFDQEESDKQTKKGGLIIKTTYINSKSIKFMHLLKSCVSPLSWINIRNT